MKIVIEGIDYTGKSSLMKRLQAALPEHGIDAVFSFEPTAAGRKKLVAAQKEGKLHEKAEKIFFDDRKRHLEDLTPEFEAGKAVFIDRHILSTVAYQGAQKGNNPALIAQTQLTEFAPADLTILLDLPVDEALKRASHDDRKAKATDAADAQFEKKEHLETSRSIYHTFLGITSIRSVVIDASRTPDEVFEIALRAVLFVLKDEGKFPQSVFCVPREVLVNQGFILPQDGKEKSSKYRTLDNGGKLNEDQQLRKLKEALSHGIWMERDLAENNPAYKQIIPSVLVTDPNGKLLYYIRKGKETRLHSKLAVTLGGHVDPEDVAGANMLVNKKTQAWNLIMAAAKRELSEEIGEASHHCGPLQLIGTVNDDSNDVGRVHFGIVMACGCGMALNLRHNHELGLIRTAPVKVLKKDTRSETWAAAILAKY